MCGTPDASNNRVIDADKTSWPSVRCGDRASPLCSSSLRNVPPPCGRNLNFVTTNNLNQLRDADPNDCGVSFQTNGVVTYAFRPNATIKPSIRFEVCEGLTNQRIAIVQGIAIGVLTGVPIIMPNMHTSFDSTLGKQTKFSKFFNKKQLRRSLGGIVNSMRYTRGVMKLIIPTQAAESIGRSAQHAGSQSVELQPAEGVLGNAWRNCKEYGRRVASAEHTIRRRKCCPNAVDGPGKPYRSIVRVCRNLPRLEGGNANDTQAEHCLRLQKSRRMDAQQQY